MVAKAKRGVISAQDRLAGLFEPDVLLPAQFFAAFRRLGGLDRERLLMLAVLEDAIDCFQKYAFAKDPRGRQLFAEAAELVEHFQWLSQKESAIIQGDKLEQVRMELADIQIYLIRIADKLNVDLLDAVERKIEINKQKYPTDKVKGQHKKYTEY